MKQISRSQDSSKQGAAAGKARERQLVKGLIEWAGAGNPSSVPRTRKKDRNDSHGLCSEPFLCPRACATRLTDMCKLIR